MNEKLETLNSEFIKTSLFGLLLADRVGDLAAQLAQRAGEEVTRPLTKAQMSRAVSVLREEYRLVWDLQWEDWDQRHADGTLPTDAYPRKPN